SYKGKLQGFTNEYYQATFKWAPGASAIIHTHPNNADPRPTDHDKQVADKYGVPNFTITNSGMYVYDPATKQTSKVLNGFDWLNPVNLSRWTQQIARSLDIASHQVPEPGYKQKTALLNGSLSKRRL